MRAAAPDQLLPGR